MTFSPRSRDEIYESMRDSLIGKITKLSNFTERSFNYVWTRAFSREVRQIEVAAVATELSGLIDYVGGPITEDDLADLGIEDAVDVDELNDLMDDQQLDEYVKILGVTRFEGSNATGSVTFTTQSAQTNIPSGTIVTTEADEDGNTLDFLTTEDASTADGVTTVSDVPIEAEEIGEAYNVPADTIIRLAEPPVGVKGVNNPASTTGGSEREENDELRSRAKKAVASSSLGGTVDGIKAYIRQNVAGVEEGDVILDEFEDELPSFVDVIVDGGTDEEVREAIDFSRPTGVRHDLVRPQVILISLDVEILGEDVDTTDVKEDIEEFLLSVGIGQNFYQDELIREIMEADDGIINIDNLGSVFEKVTNEAFTYQNGKSDYRLDFTYESTNGSIEIEDKSGDTYTEGTDFTVEDQTGDGYPETIVWTGATPDDDEDFFVDYNITVVGTTSDNDEYSTTLYRDEVFNFTEGYQETLTYNAGDSLYEISFVPFDGSSSITDNSGDTYAEGTDYEIIDDSGNGFKQTIDWSIGGATPDDREDFTITYNKKVYHTTYEHVETLEGLIRDGSGDVYDEDTEYQLVDYNKDGEDDAIEWLTNPASLNDDEEFYFTYLTEGDVFVGIREKVDPGKIEVSVK